MKAKSFFFVFSFSLLVNGFAFGQQDTTFVIDRDGNVGIGTSSPRSLLGFGAPIFNVKANNGPAALVLEAPNASGGIIEVIGNSPFRFYTNNTERLRILGNGNIGIGTSSPNSLFEVAGTIHSTNGGFKFPDGSVQTTAASGGGGLSLAQVLAIGNSAGIHDIDMDSEDIFDVNEIRMATDGTIILPSNNSAVQLRKNAHLLFTDASDNSKMAIEASSKFINVSVIKLNSSDLYISNWNETDDFFALQFGGRFWAKGNIDSDGNITAKGTKNFVQEHPNDPSKEIVYVSLEGGEAGTYVRGSARLANGEATISLPDHFELVTSSNGLTAQVTPRENCNGLYVTSLSPNKIIVKELLNGTSKVTFDYFVQGVRKGFEGHQVIRDKSNAISKQALSKQ